MRTSPVSRLCAGLLVGGIVLSAVGVSLAQRPAPPVPDKLERKRTEVAPIGSQLRFTVDALKKKPAATSGEPSSDSVAAIAQIVVTVGVLVVAIIAVAKSTSESTQKAALTVLGAVVGYWLH